MNICDINPIIRYASSGTFYPIKAFVKSYDARLFYVISGEFEISFSDTAINIRPGTLLLWKAGTRYRFFCKKKVEMLILNFDFTQVNAQKKTPSYPVIESKFDPSRISENIQFDDCPGFDQPFILKNAAAYESLLQKTVADFHKPGIFQTELAAARLKRILTECASEMVYSDSKPPSTIDKILNFIKENYQNEITNTDIANIVGYHPHYVNRLVLKHTGKTIKQLILSQRVDAAKELLSRSDVPISRIAELCGFKTAAYFSSSFKERTGIEPSIFRRKYQNLV